MCTNNLCFQTIPWFLFYSVTSSLSALCFLLSTCVCSVGRPDLCVSWLLCQDTYPAEGGAGPTDRESDRKSVTMLHTYVQHMCGRSDWSVHPCTFCPSATMYSFLCMSLVRGVHTTLLNRMCEWECGVVVYRHCRRWLRNYSVAGCYLQVLPMDVRLYVQPVYTQYEWICPN